ncbi:MFS transporter [Photorhabdus bodei]|uniref:MFS transporter n=1 Tax=Photorhabdus bodei TaxID=2029681 RepID=A0A329XCN9_9GAMM|nr:MFS transporter [Photorhabdus bodei]NDK99199.1 MFS transporter [Photorhabdus bodei]NDL03542.1 MFS transporter [Photorhabdus bodei]NDL07656.1 MFS transporter [Photorhabdus bodei]RAX14607.1 MFS transporter [Photorhabdus bodei]
MIKEKTATHASSTNFPLVALLALAMTGFLALLTETFPAGILSQISDSLAVSEALAGQFVTLYAIGSLVAAIPLTTATQGWRRRRLLLMALTGLLVFNTLTALTSNYIVALAARLLSGMAGGLIWGMLVGYARRMVPDHLKGRALAVAGVGAPLALSLGVPLGTFIGGIVGWRTTFGLMSILTLVVIAWVMLKVPDYPGRAAEKRIPIKKVIMIPGVRPVLSVLVCWVLAHSILYTYVLPFVTQAGLATRIDLVLLAFGVASLLGIWITGLLIDKMLRSLVLISLALFTFASLILGVIGTLPVFVFLAVILWGLTFGGAAALLQTALAESAGEGADVAQSILVTLWNLAIAAGGIIGGILLETLGASSFPWTLLVLLVLALLIVWNSGNYGFPHKGIKGK